MKWCFKMKLIVKCPECDKPALGESDDRAGDDVQYLFCGYEWAGFGIKAKDVLYFGWPSPTYEGTNKFMLAIKEAMASGSDR